MADTLVDDYDVVDLLTGVADRCVSLLGVSAAGVMLASPAGSLALVASSSEAMRLLELFELQEQEGPCLDAFRTGERVGHENLDAGSGRWPSFSAAALQAGFASASALPLRLRDVTLGALNLLSVTRAPMGEADVIVARAFADLATLSIAQHRASAEAQRLNEQLSGALTSRVVIEQAKGVISELAGAETSKIFLETVTQFLEAAGRGSRPAERSVGPVRHGSPEVTVAATDSARGRRGRRGSRRRPSRRLRPSWSNSYGAPTPKTVSGESHAAANSRPIRAAVAAAAVSTRMNSAGTTGCLPARSRLPLRGPGSSVLTCRYCRIGRRVSCTWDRRCQPRGANRPADRSLTRSHLAGSSAAITAAGKKIAPQGGPCRARRHPLGRRGHRDHRPGR
jgi:hypothetical protein